MKKKLKNAVVILFTVILFVSVFLMLSQILIRKTIYGQWNYLVKVGNFGLYEENSMDVIVLGASHAYCSVDNRLLKEEYNIESYTLATQQQSVKLNYYYFQEMLKTQSPDVVIVELFMVGRVDGYQTDDILHDAIDVLPMSWNKIQMIEDAVPEDKRLEYYFPIIKYHTRWKELKEEDFYDYYKEWKDEERGFVRLPQAYPVELDLSLKPQGIQKISEEDLEYLGKIVELAIENNIELIYLYAPYPMDGNGVDYAYTIELYAQKKGITYINGYELLSELNYDGATDFCDEYGHLNENGAQKLTYYLGECLKKSVLSSE